MNRTRPHGRRGASAPALSRPGFPGLRSEGEPEGMRNEVRTFVAAGPLPATDTDAETDEDPEELDRRRRQPEDLPRPVTAEEATAPVACSGPDGCSGVAWALLHFIEMAPGPSPAAPALDPVLGEDDRWHVLHRRWGRPGGDAD